MLNTLSTPLFQTWVKNVYSLWVPSGDTCVDSYTVAHTAQCKTASMGVKPQLSPQLTTSFTPSLYTVFFRQFNLLMGRLYTVSTAPIIKTKELKIRKDS